jgi:hypothetical protein
VNKQTIKLTNTEVKSLQKSLHDIIQNIDANIQIINNKEISNLFLEPIMRLTTEMSDKVFIQTKDTINEINL